MRRKDLDGLKAISIIAVILYHLGVCTYGYLGVDLFFVINGFLITERLIRNTEDGTVSYFGFIVKRFSRLYPLVIAASAVSMLLGAISMLPDNYENVAMSVVASNLFSNNILAAITTRNYWDIVNKYKPLMHTWYLGILAEFYVIYPLLFLIPAKVSKNTDKERLLNRIFVLIFVCSAISFVLFVLPFVSDSLKFYYLPFRFYELSVGGMIAFVYRKMKKSAVAQALNVTVLFLLIPLMFINFNFMDTSFRLLCVVALSCLSCVTYHPSDKDLYTALPCLATLGAKSYSYFIWHQVIFAFWRCYLGSEMDIVAVLVCLAFVVGASELSYYLLEKNMTYGKRTFTTCVACAMLMCCISGVVYLRAGVIRNVPELGIRTDRIQRQMHGDYCDRIYHYDKDFEDNGKIKVFVVGNSFARDWANILLESSYADGLEISYAFSYNKDYRERLLQSEYVFLYSQDHNDYLELKEIVGEEKIWVIGTKNFGESNDSVYLKRFRHDYFEFTVKPLPESLQINEQMKELYKDRYIDLMTPVMNENGEVRVFTEDRKFISQDCRHLTSYGADFYADIIDLDQIFSNEQ